ncbi:putative disease resistance protein RGA1 [Citrus sinensis]|nr:putative disease resistance protein RGA1 [Citrus sinensis]XP_006465020.1 putative disease resistance protein RGA1 [Citrus sinensis]XP_006465024.1 putative disease resistance protein RGA1 [Citrus sinensis]XP_052300557.1 putative disease resistance protein RGA1 [Citrus sinensis]XP_052300558.1 putative disease resistance protein RGA1 [Citrus sinensis]XP_052300559.1 putative disease resistance protein RGA1 [Citrus sinensis]XP_052300560.1 putative disease resistance protein RGA1 [Citrus sinensi
MVDAVVSVVLDQLISSAFEEAIERVRRVTAVKAEVDKLTSNLLAIKAVLSDAEQKQVKEKGIRHWLDQLKEASCDMEDVFDEWITASRRLQIKGIPQEKTVCSYFLVLYFLVLSCFGFKLRHDIAQKMKEINENLEGISKQKDRFDLHVTRSSEESVRTQSIASINLPDVRGRVEEKDTLKRKLLFESSEQQNAVQIISLIGMGGIGKTTLAQFVYNDNDVISNFEKRMWVCVSDPFDEYGIAKMIIAALEVPDRDLEDVKSLSFLLDKIEESITGKKFFLVLDDVWTEDYRKWEPFHNCLMKGSHGSKILVTTRKETVSIMMSCTDMITVTGLSTEDCWSLFESIAFFGKSSSEIGQLEAIGKSIVDKCKGLPLAVKTIGSLLRYKKTREQWQNILESEVWQIRELEEKLFAPLQLSYTDLPSEIKPCFTYCAVFSKDHSIKKDELINLWMAQGYIRSKCNEELEMIGEEYFNYLASRSFFQEFEKDDMGVVIGCKMHDITHDFAVYLTENECYSTDVNGIIKSLSSTPASQKKLRHLMLMLGHINASFSFAKLNAKKLRSLFIHSNHWVSSQELEDVFKQFTCLRALRICGENVWEIGNSKIPKAMKNLIHLRFLKLSWLRIKELPETCCELINLETLEINRCTRLKRLPQGMEKLMNLRHLIIMNHVYLEYMPRGIERLTGLRTLSEFVVGRTGGEHASKVCKLEALKGMNHLRGLLKIRMLGDLANVDEAKHVDLKEKKNLDRLELWFDNVGMPDENEENDEAITKVLQLPPNLEYLGILHYRGRSLIFPNWIESFNKLKKLLFIDCKKCESMPPLGQLPSLEVLTIWYMDSVERVGDEFLGIENSCLHGISSSSSSSLSTAFPKLKHLTIKGSKKWDEWYFAKEDITIMPQLNSLDISLCNNLKSLPDQILQSKTLENLTIEKCPILEVRFKKDTGEEWPKISHIPSIRIGHWYV